MIKTNKIDVEYIRSNYDYDSETGIIYRIFYSERNGLVIRPVGAREKSGYLSIDIKGTSFYCHRITWSYVNGDIPDGMVIDHINMKRNDNRIDNLRIGSQRQNTQNQRLPRKGSSVPHLGVDINKKNPKKKYRVQIKSNGSYIQKCFYTQEEAREYYIEIKRKIHEFGTL